MFSNPRLHRLYRRSARIALYGSLLLTLLVGALLVSFSQRFLDRKDVDLEESQSWAWVDWGALPEVQLLQGYLQVDTNVEDGSEYEGALYLARHLEAAGIPYHVERLGERRANLWAILEGESPEAVVLQGHIDVEPIRRPEAWKHPPFSGHIEAPWIYGRGAFDMKSVTAAQLHALLALKASGEPLRRSVIFLATSSEERGSDLGTRWILRQYPDWVERFWVVLTEGGLVEAVHRGEGKYWGIEVGQKRFVDILVCGDDREALEALRQALRERSEANRQRVLIPEVEQVLRSYAPTRGREELRDLLAEPRRLVLEMDRFDRLPPYLKALFRNELSPFPVEPMPGAGGYQMLVKLHVLPGEDVQEARRDLLPDWLLHGFQWSLLDTTPSPRGSSVQHPAYREMEAILQEAHPEIVVGPFLLPWTGSDARFFRQAGIPSYGFSPFLILTPDTLTGANPNERIALPGYVEGVEIYTELLRRLVVSGAEEKVGNK
jgi:acetylornithine deacetylase/succinyl-diaminopimelate desuccinylase-like protein